MIYVSGSECIGRCGQLPLKGSASSDLHQFVRIVVIKSLNSNCVLVLLFQPTLRRGLGTNNEHLAFLDIGCECGVMKYAFFTL